MSTFCWYHWFAVKLCPIGCAQDTKDSAFLCSESALVRNFWNFFLHSRVRYLYTFMRLPPRSRRSVVDNGTYGVFHYFSSAWIRHCTEFSAISLTIFVGFRKKGFNIEFSDFFTLDRMGETNFQNLNFLLVSRFPHFGLLTSGGPLWKAHLWSIRFPSVSLVCRKTFVGCAYRTPEIPPFLPCDAMRKRRLCCPAGGWGLNYETEISAALWAHEAWEGLYSLLLWHNLGITKKRSSLHLAWSRPCNDRVKLNPQEYSMQQQIPAIFHPVRSTFGEMAAEKPVLGS